MEIPQVDQIGKNLRNVNLARNIGYNCGRLARSASIVAGGYILGKTILDKFSNNSNEQIISERLRQIEEKVDKFDKKTNEKKIELKEEAAV